MPKILLKDAMWPEGKGPGWSQNPDGGMDGGQYGHIEHAVITDNDGIPLFDRAIVHETPGVITWMFARDSDNRVVSGLVKERRDTAAKADGKSSLDFWGPPRGFIDEGETLEQAAVRELTEETGARLIKGMWDMGEFIINETCTGTWTPMLAVEVDLDYFDSIKPEYGETIFKCEFFTHEDMIDMIAAGIHEGALCNSLVFIGTFQKFCIMLDSGDFDL